MKKNNINILCTIIIILGIFIIIFIGWNNFQKDSFFHPWHDSKAYQALQQIDEFKEIKIKNDKVNLSGWFWNIQNTAEPSPIVILFTGNAQNSSNFLYNNYLNDQFKKTFENYNLLIVDYPGYGLSKGTTSEKNMFLASKYIFEYALSMKETDKNSIVIMGYSIGTGVATYCASNHKATKLILLAPYDKALSLYNNTLNIFYGPLEKLTKYKFDSLSYAQNVLEPTLIFTSKTDEVINYNQAINLSNNFSNLTDLIVLDNVKHNDYFSNYVVLEKINEFLKME